MSTVRIAILGTGTIAAKLTVAMKLSPYATLYAVASRREESAKAFAEQHDIPRAYGSYEEAFSDPAVDLIYIATPHALHYPLAKKALLAGKHVLCEKPMTINSAQAEALFSLAKERRLFLSEAMWTRFLPAVTVVRQLLDEGAIGKPISMIGSMVYPMLHIPRMREPLLGGGILLDCGIYLLTTAALLFGEEITDIHTSAHLSEEGVDVEDNIALTFRDGKTASFFLSTLCYGEDRVVIAGEGGYLTMSPPYNWGNITLHRPDGSECVIPLPSQQAYGYEYMVDAVCQAILDGKTECEQTSEARTLPVLRLMDTLRTQWGMRYPEEIEAL